MCIRDRNTYDLAVPVWLQTNDYNSLASWTNDYLLGMVAREAGPMADPALSAKHLTRLYQAATILQDTPAVEQIKSAVKSLPKHYRDQVSSRFRKIDKDITAVIVTADTPALVDEAKLKQTLDALTQFEYQGPRNLTPEEMRTVAETARLQRWAQ